MYINAIEDINSQIDKIEFNFSGLERTSISFVVKKYLTSIIKSLQNPNFRLFVLILIFSTVIFPSVGYCSVESTLSGIQSKLITTILPLVAILGLLFAGLSFAAGSQNARGHLVLAIVGAVVGFGAPSIIAFIRGLVQ